MPWVLLTPWDPKGIVQCGHCLPRLYLLALASSPWGWWAGSYLSGFGQALGKALTGVLRQHGHVCAAQLPGSACRFWEKEGKWGRSIFIQPTGFTRLLCLSMTSLGTEGMETNNSPLVFICFFICLFSERKERKLRLAGTPDVPSILLRGFI